MMGGSMYKYIIRRLLLLIPVILGVTLLIFFIFHITPSDPVRMKLGEQAPPERIEAMREELGLNDPFAVQFFNYIKNAVKGDFGRSFSNNLPVYNEVISRFPATLQLATASTILAVVLGIPAGIISAVKQYTLIDGVTMILALVGVSMPVFWLGMMLVLLFSVKLKLLPASGSGTFKHLIMPAFSLGVGGVATITRMTRSSMLEVIRQDYIRTARAKGVSERVVITKHALKNALIPIVTIIGIEFGSLLGGAVLTESIFAWPGIGRLMIDSIYKQDRPMVLGCLIFITVTYSIVNLIVDIIYGYIDPRIKSQYE